MGTNEYSTHSVLENNKRNDVMLYSRSTYSKDDK